MFLVLILPGLKVKFFWTTPSMTTTTMTATIATKSSTSRETTPRPTTASPRACRHPRRRASRSGTRPSPRPTSWSGRRSGRSWWQPASGTWASVVRPEQRGSGGSGCPRLEACLGLRSWPLGRFLRCSHDRELPLKKVSAIFKWAFLINKFF